MKPTKFKEQNRILKAPENMTDEECGVLPVNSDGKSCVSCWKLSGIERIKALIFGKIWLWVWSGETQPPVSMACGKTVFERRKK